jgi:hypothetical protein
MDLEDEDALYRQLATFRRSTEFYPHASNALVYTPGVKYMAERCRLTWFIDVIAACQPRALRDPWLAEFQVWELVVSGKRSIAICSRDGEDVAFRLGYPCHDPLLGYMRLYLRNGVLMLPSEH